jgi:hypothetical protein
MILEWTLVQDSPIDFGLHSPTSYRLRRLAIFQTSKQIYAKAVVVFYRQNKFAMDGTNLKRFLFLRRANYIQHLSLHLNNDISITKVLRAIKRCQDLKSLRICLITVPRFQGRAKCNEERIRLLTFKRPTALGQINTEVYRLSPLKMILESLRCILQSILEGGGFEQLQQPSRKSIRIGSFNTGKSDRSAKK